MKEKNKNRNRVRLFPEIGVVSRNSKFELQRAGLLNPDDTVVAWVRLNPKVRDRVLTETQARQLIVLEIGRTDGTAPRVDILRRLTGYLTKLDVEDLWARMEKILNKKGCVQ